MISYIKGEVESILEDGIVLDHQGIGYEIKTPSTVFQVITSVGIEIKIYTYLYVREDALNLFGFLSRQELKVFQLLLGVSGIGPKAALAILSTLTLENLRFAVLSDDVKTISKTPGIGNKTAQKLIIELKDKMKLEDVFITNMEEINNISKMKKDIKSETILALTALGYSNTEALKAVQAVKDIENLDTEDLLKQALKKIMTF